MEQGNAVLSIREQAGGGRTQVVQLEYSTSGVLRVSAVGSESLEAGTSGAPIIVEGTIVAMMIERERALPIDEILANVGGEYRYRFWRDRGFWIGLGSMLVATALALDRDRDLRDAIDELSMLPTGNRDEILAFNEAVTAAEELEDERDRWRNTALVFGAGTVGYTAYRLVDDASQWKEYRRGETQVSQATRTFQFGGLVAKWRF